MISLLLQDCQKAESSEGTGDGAAVEPGRHREDGGMW